MKKSTGAGLKALAPGVEMGSAACSGYVGKTLALHFERGQWHMVWNGMIPAFDPDPDEDVDVAHDASVATAAMESAESNACRLLAGQACEVVGWGSDTCRDAMAAADRADPDERDECVEMLANVGELVGAGGGT